jgi:hypothetical protein
VEVRLEVGGVSRAGQRGLQRHADLLLAHFHARDVGADRLAADKGSALAVVVFVV